MYIYIYKHIYIYIHIHINIYIYIYTYIYIYRLDLLQDQRFRQFMKLCTKNVITLLRKNAYL